MPSSTSLTPGVLLVEVTRGGHVESVHQGSVIALRADGSTALALGDVTGHTFPRSSNKPLQAVGMLEAGWVPADTQELALAAASHSGEPRHLDVVRRMLGSLQERSLGCPPALPLDTTTAYAVVAAGGGPTRLQMNCSGKHAAMLATCVAAGWPLADYLSPEHPLQVHLTATVARLSGEPDPPIVIDGCGAPQHGLSLPGLARAFSRIVTAGDGTPERRVADAVRAHPGLVGGTGRDVTALMESVPGLLAKDGAEGVYAAALPDGSAVALKIDDGASRARTPVLVEALRALGADVSALGELAELAVLGGDQQVGAVRIAGALAQRA